LRGARHLASIAFAGKYAAHDTRKLPLGIKLCKNIAKVIILKQQFKASKK
jgi:hypothetical protein